MRHALAKPDALMAGITRLVDSLPPEFTQTVQRMQNKMLQQAEQVVSHLPAGLLESINQAAPGAIPPIRRPLEGQADQSRSTIFLGAQPTTAQAAATQPAAAQPAAAQPAAAAAAAPATAAAAPAAAAAAAPAQQQATPAAPSFLPGGLAGGL